MHDWTAMHELQQFTPVAAAALMLAAAAKEVVSGWTQIALGIHAAEGLSQQS